MSAKFPRGGSKPILSHPSNIFKIGTCPIRKAFLKDVSRREKIQKKFQACKRFIDQFRFEPIRKGWLKL